MIATITGSGIQSLNNVESLNSSSKKDCKHPIYHYDGNGDRRCDMCNEIVSLKRSPS